VSAHQHLHQTALALFVLAACTVAGSGAQWSRQPGDRVRDAFGPVVGDTATACRGACGGGCLTKSCIEAVTYEVAASDRLRRVRSYTCGTHQGCREHDDCLDRCLQRRQQGLDCEGQCHAEALKTYGFESGTSWAAGGGPFDNDRITFEYTRDAPGAPEPLFRCPAGSQLNTASGARCLAVDGREVTPVFDAYAGAAGGVGVTGFRSGRVCRAGGTSSVCEQTVDVTIAGDAQCAQAGGARPCTWYGFEFDYTNADPAAPLVCSTYGATDDFMGRVVGRALTAVPADESTELGALLGKMQGELARGRSLTDLLSGIKVRPAGQPAPAVEAPPGPAPGVPSSVDLPSASGHLVVPMYELADGAVPGSVLVREVRCTHNGSPVLETSFRLHFSGR
jgi:hypothetical protein